MRVTAIVEGHGDVMAMPTLIAKVGSALGLQLYSDHPIRSGGWPKLKRAGELERFVELAITRKSDRIIIVSDLDDGCPVDEYRKAVDRTIASIGSRAVPFDVSFCLKEYESWLLSGAPEIAANLGITSWDLTKIPAAPESVRGAKEALSSVMKTRYKETIHQSRLTNGIDVGTLIQKSRSFRKFVKAASGVNV